MNISSNVEKIPPSDPRHPEFEAHLQWLRGLTMEERGRMIVEACRKAMEEECARIAAGLPPTEPEPMPPDTLELFRRLCAEYRSESEESELVTPNDSE